VKEAGEVLSGDCIMLQVVFSSVERTFSYEISSKKKVLLNKRIDFNDMLQSLPPRTKTNPILI
jgi:hypothetical protein